MLIHHVIMIVLFINSFVFGMEHLEQVKQDLAVYRKNVRDMMYAVENNNVSSEILCNHYCNLSRPIFNYNDSKGKFWKKVTPLMLATFYGRQEMVTFLLEKKVIINIKDEDGDTALHIAARTGQDKVVEWLLKAGADRNKKNKNGDTALLVAKNSLVRRYGFKNYQSIFENIIKMLTKV